MGLVMIKKQPEYTLFINHGTRNVGTLVLDKTTNLLKLEYTHDWQQSGFPISPALSLDNQHTPEVAYNYLDNALPEGEARKLLADELGVSEKNVYSQVRPIGDDLTSAITFTAIEPQLNSTPKATEPRFRIIKPEELSERLTQKEDIGLLLWDDKPRLSVAGVQDKLNVFINEQGQITAANTVSVATDLSIAGDSGTDTISLLSDTFSFVGGASITTATPRGLTVF